MYKFGIILLAILCYISLQWFVESAKPCSAFSRDYGICGTELARN